MGLRIIYGRAGTGKSEKCFREVANLINKKSKVYIITPEQFSFTAEKKLMECINNRAVLNAEVITFNRIAYRIMQEIGGVVKTNLSSCGKAMLVYSILHNQKNNLKFLGKSDETIDISLSAITEFKKHGITTNMLKENLNSIENNYLKIKLQDISLIYEIFEKHLEGKYIDETDLLTITAENIDKIDMFKDSVIYIDEFSGFTSQEYNIIEKLIKISKKITVTVCADSLETNTNPDTDIFYTNKQTAAKIIDLVENKKDIELVKLDTIQGEKSEEIKFIEKNLFKINYDRYKNFVNNIEMFLAKNRYSEIEHIAETITKEVRENGLRYKDISVITKDINIYSNLIRAIFQKYNIPTFIDEKRDLNQNIVIKYILALLDIFNKNWSFEAMFNYIKSGFIKIDDESIYKLENYCIKWGIKQSKWKKEFEHGEEEELEELNNIRKSIVEPLINLKNNIDKEKTALGISNKLYEFLQEQEFEKALQEKINYLNNLGKIDLANEYMASYNIFINLLDEIVMIFKNDKITIDKYINILKVGLKNSGLGKIPVTADQVIVGDVDRSKSRRAKIVFIIGINDGAFPKNNTDEGFLNDLDREYLKNSGLEIAKGTIENLYEDNFNIYKSFSMVGKKLYLSYVSADNEGRTLRPSMLIFKIKKMFPELQEKSDVIIQKKEVSAINSTYEELIVNINRLKSGEHVEKIWYSVYKYYMQNVDWNKRLQKDIQGLFYTNEPEVLKQENVEKLYGNTMHTSISKLERYRSCPFSYYIQYGLKLKEREEFKVQSLDTGNFMHETIDEFFETVREKGLNLDDLTEANVAQIVENIIEEKLKVNKKYILLVSTKYMLLVSRLKRIITKSLKYIIQTLTNSNFNVLGTEIEFSKEGNYEPIVLNLENGKSVELTGKIDRVDIAKSEEGTYLRIIDYKSSVKDIDLNEVYAGIQIQLLTYLDAVCKVEDFMPAGILYFGLLEQMIKADKKMTEEEIEERIKANFRMKGLILADVKVVKMHDKTITTGKSNIVPAYIDKQGNLGKNTNGVTKSQFKDLQEYIYKTIKEISKEIFKGKIDLKPYYKKGKTPCDYCNYKGICNFKAGFCNNEYNFIDTKTKEEVLHKIKNQKDV